MDITKTVEFLKGKKRYILALALGIVVILKALGYSIPQEVYSIFGLQDVQVTPIVETVDTQAN
ncbi:MAG: hypothetical protein WCR96_05695 [Candidatus Methanomethylophilaceae archaeon]